MSGENSNTMARPSVNKETRDLIVTQALQEIQFARTFKQGKIKNWKTNEQLYYSRKVASADSMANVDLGQMASFVHTLLSKIDNPLTFKFTKRKDAQIKRVKLLNALKTQDQSDNDWDIKDIAGKKQAVIYGRAIYSYFADSQNGYKAHLDPIDVYDFLVDPSSGGIDIEKAMYIGDYGVVYTKTDLKAGIKDGSFLKAETQELIDGVGNSTAMTTEETNKKARTTDTNVQSPTKEIGNPDKFKFWRWGTTYEGQRYYLTLSETGAKCIECVLIEEKFESGLWWYWTWAAFPDLTEFWTPSFCDYVREIFMAQAVSINQALDNAEKINKPQKLIQTGAIENLAELKYRRDGTIKVKKDIDVNKAYQTVITPSITTPFEVFRILDAIQEKASGVTAAAQGDSRNDSGAKLGIYKGNQENTADRFGFLNRSYSFGYKRFSILYRWGVKDHLIRRKAIDMLGPDGVEVIEANRRDIFRKDDEFNVLVEASNAELALSEQEKMTKLAFIAGQAAIPIVAGTKPIMNPHKAFEIQATIAGFDEETIRQLQDTSEYGDAELMSEAERDIEALIDNEKVLPNANASIAYKQRFVDYMQDHQENLSMEEFKRLADYLLSLDQIIIRNMVRQAEAEILRQQMELARAPIYPNIQPDVVDQGSGIPIQNNQLI